MILDEIAAWFLALQGVIGFILGTLFGGFMVFYALRGMNRREVQRMRREAWLVIVGDLASYSTFAESLSVPSQGRAGELARAIHETLHRLPPMILNESSFAGMMLDQPAICRELQIFLLRSREVSSLADILRTTIGGAASERLDTERCAHLLEMMVAHARSTGQVADRVIGQIDAAIFNGRLGDPVAHMPVTFANPGQLSFEELRS